jgi:hypothetical protein
MISAETTTDYGRDTPSALHGANTVRLLLAHRDLASRIHVANAPKADIVKSASSDGNCPFDHCHDHRGPNRRSTSPGVRSSLFPGAGLFRVLNEKKSFKSRRARAACSAE